MKIFDSLTHPTIVPHWLNYRFNRFTNIELLIYEMEKNNIEKAFAVGMQGIGGYSHHEYLKFILPFKNLIPTAFPDIESTLKDLANLKNMGFNAIKIHPRLMKIDSNDPRIVALIKNSNAVGMLPFYCSWSGIGDDFLENIGDSYAVILHTGGYGFKNIYNNLKKNPNLLLDFSYTMCIEQHRNDVREVFFSGYDRICVGSDHPEFMPVQLRQAFEVLTTGLPAEHKKQIAYENLDLFYRNAVG